MQMCPEKASCTSAIVGVGLVARSAWAAMTKPGVRHAADGFLSQKRCCTLLRVPAVLPLVLVQGLLQGGDARAFHLAGEQHA